MIEVELSEDQVDEMMKLADLNKDGQINFDGKQPKSHVHPSQLLWRCIFRIQSCRSSTLAVIYPD
jgi:hypothetical protein